MNLELRCYSIDKDLMIKDLEDQVVKWKLSELDKALAFNSDLESQNHKLSQELAAAHSKIATLSPQRESVGEHQSPKFKDIQKLIANKLERSVVKNDTISKANINVNTASCSPPSPSPSPSPSPPPPPPPPPISPSPKVSAVEKKAPMPSSMPLPPPLPPPPPLLHPRLDHLPIGKLRHFWNSINP